MYFIYSNLQTIIAQSFGKPCGEPVEPSGQGSGQGLTDPIFQMRLS